MKNIKDILLKVRNREMGIRQAMDEMKFYPYEDLGFAKIDHHRELRKGIPEVVFCPGKKPEQIAAALKNISKHADTAMATRASEQDFDIVKKFVPGSVYFRDARIIAFRKKKKLKKRGCALVMSAGSSDIPVAEEAAVTLELLGNRVVRLYDVGVAGLHRLLSNKDKVKKAKVVIVVAGMEGALASVVGGMSDKPVIAVPTSIGYGASFRGIAPLLTMLNCCAPGVSVVNIDNGFGAGYFAHLINR